MPKDKNTPGTAEWNRTVRAQDRLRASSEYEPYRPGDKDAPYGRFTGRPVIGSGMSRVNGGVYLGANAREAIVVDDEPGTPAGEFLRRQYAERLLPLVRELADGYKRDPKDVALLAVFQEVLRSVRYDARMTEGIVRHHSTGRPDQKMHLAMFVHAGAGVCRHQALLAAYLLERLMQESDRKLRLNGQFSLERNQVAMTDENQHLAHVWVRYTTSDGEVYIIDPAQRKFGRLRDLMGQAGAWEYARPEDLARPQRN